ncbi:MAG: LamG domain-containing protein, partial [Myxococcota bacterium]
MLSYHADGSLAERIDQRGVRLTYAYDDAGRRTSQAVSKVGTSWTEVGDLRVEYAFDSVTDRLETVTTYDVATGGSGNETSQVEYAYDGFGRITTEYQQHGGVVNTSTSPSVAYAFDTTADGNGKLLDGGRLNYVTYPNGRQIHYQYDTGDQSAIGDAISRVTRIVDSTYGGTTHAIDTNKVLAKYLYLGSGRVMVKDLPLARVRLDYADDPDTTVTTESDSGLDPFGRVTRQIWDRYDNISGDSTANPVFDIRHDYDFASNRLNARRGVYQFTDTYEHDDLHRLIQRARTPQIASSASEVGTFALEGNANDDSGNTNHGTLVGSPTFNTTSAFAGDQSLVLDGINDFLDIDDVAADALTTDDSFTLAAWFKRDAHTGPQEALFGINTATSGNKTMLYMGRGSTSPDPSHYGELVLYNLPGGWGADSDSSIDDNTWRHVVLRFDDAANELSVFRDGVQIGNQTVTVTTNYTPTDLWSVGSEYDSGFVSSDHFEGEVDEVRVFGTPLTPVQLAALAGQTQESWDLSQTGNWNAYTRDGVTDTRTHTAANEIATSTAAIDPVHDAAGNIIEMPYPGRATEKVLATYDAWNRLVEVKLDFPPPTSLVMHTAAYDGLGRR